jgi:hypothetical protein
MKPELPSASVVHELRLGDYTNPAVAPAVVAYDIDNVTNTKTEYSEIRIKNWDFISEEEGGGENNSWMYGGSTTWSDDLGRYVYRGNPFYGPSRDEVSASSPGTMFSIVSVENGVTYQAAKEDLLVYVWFGIGTITRLADEVIITSHTYTKSYQNNVLSEVIIQPLKKTSHFALSKKKTVRTDPDYDTEQTQHQIFIDIHSSFGVLQYSIPVGQSEIMTGSSVPFLRHSMAVVQSGGQTIDFVDIGDVLNYEFLKGVIQSINTDNDTCVVNIGGASIAAALFFNYGDDEIMRENGALQGAASEFVIGDQVIVMKSINKVGGQDVIKVLAPLTKRR